MSHPADVLDLSSLRAKHPGLAAVADLLNCGFMARDADRVVTFVNQRLLSWLGYSKPELVGRPAENLLPPEIRPLLREEMESMDAGDRRVRLTTLQRKDSTTFPVLIIPHPLRDSKGREMGGFSLVVDLGAVQTAKNIGYGSGHSVRATLQRIALELQSIGLATDLATPKAIPFHHPDLKLLSVREKEVLTRLVDGDRVPAISKRLHISPHTVRNHLKAIYRKLDVGTQSDLIERVRALASSTA